jgi:protein-tyrosine phosphatase
VFSSLHGSRKHHTKAEHIIIIIMAESTHSNELTKHAKQKKHQDKYKNNKNKKNKNSSNSSNNEQKKQQPAATEQKQPKKKKVPLPFGMHELLNYLYSGTVNVACEDKLVLERIGITHIINCVGADYECEFPDDFKYTELELEDNHLSDAAACFDDVFTLLQDVKAKGGKCLVHCENGKSIAPTICIAYMLMASAKAKKHLPLAAALQHCKRKEPGIKPNDNFMRQLMALEKELYGENSVKLPSRHGGGGRGGRRRGGKGRGGKGRRGK